MKRFKMMLGCLNQEEWDGAASISKWQMNKNFSRKTSMSETAWEGEV
jgi:hypothetical protein